MLGDPRAVTSNRGRESGMPISGHVLHVSNDREVGGIWTYELRQMGLEVTLTNALVNEFIQHRKGMVVNAAQAQSLLSGTIVSMETNVVSRNSDRIISQREVVITLSLTLKNKSGDIIWRDSNLRAKQSYSVSDDALATEANRRGAIERVVQRLAEDAYNGVVHGF